MSDEPERIKTRIAKEIVTSHSADGEWFIFRMKFKDEEVNAAVSMGSVPKIINGLVKSYAEAATRQASEVKEGTAIVSPIRSLDLAVAFDSEPGTAVLAFPLGATLLAVQCPLEALRRISRHILEQTSDVPPPARKH